MILQTNSILSPSQGQHLREVGSQGGFQTPAAGLISGGSIFPHTQHKGRRKIG